MTKGFSLIRTRLRRNLVSVQGFSLIEVMVVLTVFSVLAIISTQAILTTLNATTRAQSATKVRGDVDFAISVIERNIHNAAAVSSCAGQQSSIQYIDGYGNSTSFSCIGVGGGGDAYIASGSARLTSTNIKITDCAFSCEDANGTVPPKVTVVISAKDARKTGLEGATMSTSTEILLRSY